MRIRTLVYLVALLLVPVAAHPQTAPDSCATEPAIPPELEAFRVTADAARAAGRKPDMPSPAVTAAYAAWQQKLFAVDFPGVCRYRAANAACRPQPHVASSSSAIRSPSDGSRSVRISLPAIGSTAASAGRPRDR
jgi:hypothetical protein